MTQTLNLGANLGAANTGLTIGYRILDLDGTVVTAFTTTNVTEAPTAGTYYVATTVSVPDAGGVIIWGESGNDIVTDIIDPVPVVDLVADAVDADALATSAVAEINATVDTAIGDAALATAAALATVDTNVDAIKAKTDNLPADPADASDVAGAIASATGTITSAITTSEGNIRGADSDTLETLSDQLDLSATATALAAVQTAIDALTSLSASDVWTYATRTLTQSTASIVAAVEGTTLGIVRAATFDVTISGLAIPGSWETARFTVKKRSLKTQPDATSALIQILVTNGGDEGDGLVVLNSSDESLTAANASLTVAPTSVDVHIEDAVTAVMATGNYEYDIKFYYGTSDSVIVATGECSVSSTPTETV